MLEVQLPIRKYQKIAAIAAVVGFLLGMLIPVLAFRGGYWLCPFGSGLIRTGGFVLLTGILSAVVIGNVAAFLLITIAKLRQSSSVAHTRPKN